MRLHPFFLLLAVSLFVLAGCKKDADPNIPVIDMATDFVLSKSDRNVEVALEMKVPDGVKSLHITKGVNLQPDAGFVIDTLPASLGENKYRFVFKYVTQRPEIDKLVGFNFKLTDNQGRVTEKDLTLHTEANGAETIYSRNWKITSQLRITATPASEEIDNCVKDNTYKFFKKNDSMSVDFGAPNCGFEGFNIYDKWKLSEDEKTFEWEFYNVFNPAQRTKEVFKVRSISSSELKMDIVIDLSWLGPPYTDKEQFVYTFIPVP